MKDSTRATSLQSQKKENESDAEIIETVNFIISSLLFLINLYSESKKRRRNHKNNNPITKI